MYKIFELQVVSSPSVHRLSFTATGTPARGPFKSPWSICFCTIAACLSAPSLSIVTKACRAGSSFSIWSRQAFTPSSTPTSLSFIFLPNWTAVKSNNLLITVTPFWPLLYSTVLGTLKAPSLQSGAFFSMFSLLSPLVTISSRNTLFLVNT